MDLRINNERVQVLGEGLVMKISSSDIKMAYRIDEYAQVINTFLDTITPQSYGHFDLES